MFTIIQCSIFFLTIGKNPSDVKIGVVNEELPDYQICLNVMMNNWKCNDTMSCRFLNLIPTDLVNLVYYI